MSIGETSNASTIDDKLLDIIIKGNITKQQFDELSLEINQLKNYFETKYKINIYELLGESILNKS